MVPSRHLALSSPVPHQPVEQPGAMAGVGDARLPTAQGESVHFNEALMQADSSDGGHGWTVSAPKDKGTRQGHCRVGPGSHLPDRR